MSSKMSRKEQVRKRHYRIRKNLTGSLQRPRLSVYKSGRHIYAQLIVDEAQGSVTMASASTLDESLRSGVSQPNVEAAKKVGQLIAERAVAKGILSVVFDRGGYKYHANGKIAAIADAAREAGLQF
jgi:large subunit ribosomal protein L18